MSIFNLFRSKPSDDDDDRYSSPNYSETHYRDDPFYQELLGISEEDRESEREAEADEAEAEAEAPKKWWQL